MEKKDVHEQITANQLAGMSLEEAIYQAGYSNGVEYQLKKTQAQGLGLIEEKKELPAQIKRDAEVRATHNPNTSYHRGYKDGEIFGATAYATKLVEAEEKHKQLIKTLLEIEEGKRKELEEKIKVLDYDNKRLSGELEGYKYAVEEMKVQATGWRPLLEDILREDDNNISCVSVDLLNKIKKFLYGE